MTQVDRGDSQGEANLVSVVVIGRNEGERLRLCLRSIFAMDLHGFAIEVIYVDSDSKDSSVALARTEGATTIALAQDRPTAALGRNAGWRAARGSIVLFLDGDTVLHPQFVAESLGEFASQEVAVVWGHRRESSPRRSIYNRVLDLDWIYPPGFTDFCGGDALFRRQVLTRTGGFDPTLIAGEEPELCRRILELGFQILHVDRPMTAHDLAITRWSQYWKRCIRSGHAFAEVAGRFRNTMHPFWSEEIARNRNRFFAITLILLAAVLGSIVARSLMPLATYFLGFALLSLRSAWKAAWKSTDRNALLLYGVHSHLQQIPIYLGQLQFRRSQRLGRKNMLLEYK